MGSKGFGLGMPTRHPREVKREPQNLQGVVQSRVEELVSGIIVHSFLLCL